MTTPRIADMIDFSGLAPDLAAPPADGVGAVALVEFLLRRIDALNPHLNALTQVLSDQARAEAAKAEERLKAGDALSPIDGLPIVLKDNIDMAGAATTAGSLTRLNAIAEADAEIVSRLRQAGAIILGHAVSSEFALEPYGTNHHFGTPRNAWGGAVHRMPGGSSAGSAVAVAAGLACGALGTDTGGSCRLPAAWNGVVGMRPTPGAASMRGIAPLSTTLDVVGPIAVDVDTAGELFDVISGGEAYLRAKETRIGRILRLPDAELADVEPDIREAYERCLEALAAAGYAVGALELETSFRGAAVQSGFISLTEAYTLYGSLLETEASSMDPAVVRRLSGAPDIRPVDYRAAVAARPAAQRAHLVHWGDATCLLTPASVFTAPVFDGAVPTASPSAFLRPVGYLGLCALSTPFGFDRSGLPIGLQLVGRPHRESDVFHVASVIETFVNQGLAPGETTSAS